MLKLTNGNVTPPDKFRYTHREDGWRDVAMDKDWWFKAILKHKRDNGYAIPDDWQAQAEDSLCRILPPGWCAHEDGRLPEQYLNARISLDDIVNGTKVLGTFVWQGMPTVPQAQVESRAATCASCYMNVPIPGCSPCVGLANLIAEFAGNIKTPADPMLKSCLVCKCANQAQTRLPIEVLAKGVTAEMMEHWPAHCWKKNELLMLENSNATE